MISLYSSAQNRRIEYGDLDLFLHPKEELVYCLERSDLNYDTTMKNKLCVDIDRNYSISIEYDNDNNVKVISIKNHPYSVISLWSVCIIDNRNRLCYLYRSFTYSVEFINNELVLKMI